MKAKQPDDAKPTSSRLTDEQIRMIESAPGADRTAKLLSLIERGAAAAPTPVCDLDPVTNYVRAQVAAGREPIVIPAMPDTPPVAMGIRERQARAQHLAADYVRDVVEPSLVAWILGDDTGIVAADLAQETEKVGALRVNTG